MYPAISLQKEETGNENNSTVIQFCKNPKHPRQVKKYVDNDNSRLIE